MVNRVNATITARVRRMEISRSALRRRKRRMAYAPEPTMNSAAQDSGDELQHAPRMGGFGIHEISRPTTRPPATSTWKSRSAAVRGRAPSTQRSCCGPCPPRYLRELEPERRRVSQPVASSLRRPSGRRSPPRQPSYSWIRRPGISSAVHRARDPPGRFGRPWAAKKDLGGDGGHEAFQPGGRADFRASADAWRWRSTATSHPLTDRCAPPRIAGQGESRCRD